ncbi:MAG: FAD-dependent thymidylate synthase [Clostridiales bacterium]|nr:FAD-dependent thymidylate synthase [Clostridiales bacterium]
MKIIPAKVEFITPIDGNVVMKRLEECGRVCYKSEDKITEDSAEKFLRGVIRRGHESVLEHCFFTVRFTVDRGISHELVRHRIASFSQESTRYCNYSKDGFGNEITVIKPCFLQEDTLGYAIWESTCEHTEKSYFDMLGCGCTPQEARSVLPNSLKTEVVMTCNIREWRHFLLLRCSKTAHSQMREVATQLLEMVMKEMPVLFEDIAKEVSDG